MVLSSWTTQVLEAEVCHVNVRLPHIYDLLLAASSGTLEGCKTIELEQQLFAIVTVSDMSLNIRLRYEIKYI